MYPLQLVIRILNHMTSPSCPETHSKWSKLIASGAFRNCWREYKYASCLFMCLSVHVSVCLFMCLYVCLFMCLSVCSCVCMSVCSCVCISVCSYVCLFCVSVCSCVCMSIPSCVCLICMRGTLPQLLSPSNESLTDLMTHLRGNSLIKRLFIHRKANCKW